MAVVLTVLFLSQLTVVKTSRFWVAAHFEGLLATVALAYLVPAPYEYSSGRYAVRMLVLVHVPEVHGQGRAELP